MNNKRTIELEVDELGFISLEAIMKHVHLCKHCEHDFGNCKGIAEFGNGYGMDNIFVCDRFDW